MSTTPTLTDQSQTPITAADPRVQRILDLIRAKNGPQAPLDTTATPTTALIPQQPTPQVPTQLGGPSLSQQFQQANQPLGPPPVVGNLAPMPSAPPQLPQPPAPNVVPPSKPGPIKAFLQHLASGLGSDIYAGAQAAKQQLGIPTDYQMQQNAAHLGIAQQAANDTTAWRKAQIGGLQSKSDLLDSQNAPYTFADDDSVAPSLRGKTFPTIVAQGFIKQGLANQGKADVATIAANAGAINLSPEYAQRIGMPQLAGQPVGGKTLASMNRMLQGLGANIIEGDIGNGHVGLIDKDTRKVLQDYGPSQRIVGAGVYTGSRPVQIVNPDGSTTYDSAAHAIATHAQGTQGIGFQTDKALQKYFTSGAGGANLTAFHTATAHLDLLQSLTGALNNGDVQLINKYGNEFAKQTGATAPTNFAAAKTAVAGEIAKVFKGVATEGEIASITQEINDAQSPQQLYGVINTNKTLMQGKVNALRDQYNAGRQGHPNFDGAPPTVPPASPAASGLGVKLSDAMSLPQNKGKTAQQVTADIQAHGHTVIQ